METDGKPSHPMAPDLPAVLPQQNKKTVPNWISRPLLLLAFVVGMAAFKFLFSGGVTGSHSATPTVADANAILDKEFHLTKTVKVGDTLIPCDLDFKDHHGTVTYHFADGTTKVLPIDVYMQSDGLLMRMHYPDGTTGESVIPFDLSQYKLSRARNKGL